ncbi:hypothetical protein B8W70_02200 [Pseudomonas sp. 1239]|uniref:hypothetical protein n=1 Tax=Pseudomonas TaxID=286 RepID=UPI0005C12AC2|nr:MULTISPECIES: hypothetical protein [Pseudomonas]KIU52279.1 hypothetical protein QV12_09320 [Pseudomonas putida]OUM35497.1 hypothetical protein B8W70_02200 [Pseudomonas sp. 1239]WKL66515.1 hypothetical protein Q1Z72_25040 [Pseudomonas qingdaonensis]
MASFIFSAQAVDGKTGITKGSLEAANKQDAEQRIKAMFSYPVKISLMELPLISEEAADPPSPSKGETDLQIERANTYHSEPKQ